MPSQKCHLGTLKSKDGRFIIARKRMVNGNVELKLCAVDQQPSTNSVPSVEIHYRGNDMAFIFRYDNINYSLTVEKNKLKLKEGNDQMYWFMKFDLGTGEHHGLQTKSTVSPNEFWYISKDHEQNVLLTNNRANCVPVKVENKTTNSSALPCNHASIPPRSAR